MSLTRNGQVRYELKTPWQNGTTHVIFEPLDFISRLVALVPEPRVNLIRFHGVFAPNSHYRALVKPAKRRKSTKDTTPEENQTPAEHQAWPRPASRPVPGLTFSMTWAKRLKRVFQIDIAYMDVGKGREQDAVASKPVVNAAVLSKLSPVLKTRR